MSRLALDALVPEKYDSSRFRELMRRIAEAFNANAEGRLAGRHFNRTTIPTTGTFARGDIVWKSDLTEAGAAASKYVVIGWCCTASGTPGTFLEMRVLTGN